MILEKKCNGNYVKPREIEKVYPNLLKLKLINYKKDCLEKKLIKTFFFLIVPIGTGRA